jgi:Tol biopolymer transport system component
MTGDVPGPAQRVNHILSAAGGLPENEFIGTRSYAWSPDSSRVVYYEPLPDYELAAGDLWIVDVSGPVPGTPRRIRLNGGIVPQFSWSPDSSRLLFSRARTLAPYIVDTSAAVPGPPVRLGGAIGLRYASFTWSPDSAWIAMHARVGDGPYAVWLANAATPEEASVVSAPAGDGGEVTGGPIRWSFDSKRLLYEVRHLPHIEVWLVDMTSGTPAPAVQVNGSLVDGGQLALRQYWFAPAFTP